jgi:AcrR family transcriptional regulator
MAVDPEEATRRRLARKAQRQERRREHLLDLADELFAEDGHEPFTIAALAARADLSKAAVYYYFPSRDEVLAALMTRYFREETAAMQAAVDAAPDGPGILEGILRGYVGFYAPRLDAFRRLQAWTLAAGPQPELLQRAVYPLAQGLMGPVEARLREAQAAGELRDDVDPRRLANVAHQTAVGMITVASLMERLGGDTLYRLEEMLEEACAAIRRSALPDPATSGRRRSGQNR